MSESRPIRVLYMEDDRGLARLVQKRLGRAGYAVDLADDGDEGLAKHAAGSYDAVAVDHAMPGRDGLEVVRILASRGPLPPTIMVTGAGDETVAVETMKLGAADYIVKDAAGRYLGLLPSVIEQALRHHRLALDKQRAEEALRESESKYRTLLESLPQNIFAKDRDCMYVSCNGNFARDLGIEPEKLGGHTDYDFFPKELADKYRADDQRVMASGQTEELEERYVRKGQEVIVHTAKTPVRDEQGNVVGLLGIFWDITERVEAEEELKRTLADLEQFNRLAVGRELRMIELKREVNEMAVKAGIAAPYDLSSLEPDNGAGLPGGMSRDGAGHSQASLASRRGAVP